MAQRYDPEIGDILSRYSPTPLGTSELNPADDFAGYDQAVRKNKIRRWFGIDPELPLDQYTGQALRNFGLKAVNAIPGVTSTANAIEEGHQGNYGKAAFHGGLAAVELGLPFVLGNLARYRDGSTLEGLLGAVFGGLSGMRAPVPGRSSPPMVNADVSVGIPMDAPARAYRGSGSNAGHFKKSDRMFSSDDPKVAATYADWGGNAPNIMPVDVQFRNPITYSLREPAPYHDIRPPKEFGGEEWFGLSTDDLARRAKKLGHDGVVFRNIMDNVSGSGPPSTVYVALGRGTVKSPLSGETIYGLAPFAGAAALPGVVLDRHYGPDAP